MYITLWLLPVCTAALARKRAIRVLKSGQRTECSDVQINEDSGFHWSLFNSGILVKHQFKKVIVMVHSQPVNIGVGRVPAGMDDATSSLVGSRVVIAYLFANTICGRSGIYPKQYVCMSLSFS